MGRQDCPLRLWTALVAERRDAMVVCFFVDCVCIGFFSDL